MVPTMQDIITIRILLGPNSILINMILFHLDFEIYTDIKKAKKKKVVHATFQT